MREQKPLEQRDVIISQLADYARVSDQIIELMVRRAQLRKALIFNGLLFFDECTETSSSVPPPTANIKP